MTVEPNTSPAYALPSHQPTCWTFSGTTSSPWTVWAGSTRALAPPGSTRSVGTKRTAALGAGLPTRALGTGVDTAPRGAGASGTGCDPQPLTARTRTRAAVSPAASRPGEARPGL